MFFLNAPSVAAALLLAVAVLFGGGGDGFPATELAVELTGVGALAVALIAGRGRLAARQTAIPLILIGLTLLLILVQLMPLPPSLWAGLSGRGALWETAQAVGMASEYRPLSLDPEATVGSALSLIPAIAMFLLMLLLPERDLGRTVALFVALIAAHLVAAALQVASGGTAFYPYPTYHEGVAVGLFANRNHLGTLLLVGALCSSAALGSWQGPSKPTRLMLLVASVFAFAAGVLATRSRTAAALLLIVLLLAPLLFGLPAMRRRTYLTSATLGAVFLGAIIFLSLGSSSPVGSVVERFQHLGPEENSRYGIWQDTLYGAQQFFPAGSGLGTYVAAFSSVERLSEVGSHYANHAHNDYLEFLLEMGLGGALLLASFLAWFIWRSWRVWRPPTAPRPILFARAASLSILLILLHSLVDYPLRTLAISTSFAFLAALLTRDAQREQ